MNCQGAGVTRGETIALFLECEAKRVAACAAALADGKSRDDAKTIAHGAAKTHWNTWAEALLAERKAMEADGRWDVEMGWQGSLEPKNELTRTWMKKAAADFSRWLFESHHHCDGAQSVAGSNPEPESTTLDLHGAGTPRDDGNKTNEPPAKSIQLEGDCADFSGFMFPGIARFDSATFTGVAWFYSATFSRYASFKSAIFYGCAGFKSSTFSGDAQFKNATFSDNASFESATFRSSTSFGKTGFKDEAKFTRIKVDRDFDITGATFAKVPNFNKADFKQAPDLESVAFPLPVYWRRGYPELIPLYRALRHMAIPGADYEREQMAFKGELRSRRWTQDKWWHAGTWLGLFYDSVADCGRSIVRPAGVWLASIAAFAAFYWQRAAVGIETRCVEAGGAGLQALYLSVKNALVVFGGTRDARVNQAYLCLYNGSAEQPHIPPTVTFVETLAQIPFSATLIFLFLLAVKNRFKIK